MKLKLSKYEWLLLFIPIFICVILRLMGFDGNVGQDSYAYTEYAQELQKWIKTGIKPKPFFWPPGYPLVAALLSIGLLPISFVLQFISSISLGVTLIILHKINLGHSIKPIEDKYSFYYLIIWGLLAPYVFRNSVINSSDMLACGIVTCSIFFYYRYLKHSKLSDLIILTTLVSYCLLVRYVSFVVLFPIIFHTIVHWFKKEIKIVQVLILCIPISVIFIHIYFKGDGVQFLHHESLTNWNVKHLLYAKFSTLNGHFQYAFPNIIYALFPFIHPGFCLLGILFIAFTKKSRFKIVAMPILSILLFSIFIAGYYNQNPRFLLIIYPYVLFVCFQGFSTIIHKIKEKRFLRYLCVGLILFQMALSARAFYPTWSRNKLEKFIASDITTFINSSTPVIYSFDIANSLKNRQNLVEVKNLYDSVYSHYVPNSLLLLNEQAWEKQWHNKNPMININNLKNLHSLKILKSYDKNWILYRIEN